jgi:predicted amidohydrolase YtcJ
MEWFHPYRKWWDAGVTIGGGSDHMIRMDPTAATNPWDPWLGIWIAVSRKVEGASPLDVDQRLSREEAIRFYTINNARLHSEEDEKGSIEPGKLADLVVLDRDLFTVAPSAFLDVRVLATLVEGEVVHAASGSPLDSQG